MRWSPEADNSNIEDRRGIGGAGVSLGLGGFLLLGVLSLVFGRNFFALAGIGAGSSPRATAPGAAPKPGEADKTAEFATFVFNDTQRVWTSQLARTGVAYPDAKMVLFTSGVRTACGNADSSVGPFYCPADTRVYLDLGFFQELARRFRAPGDFAQAYVIAHEVGHHVQHVLGTDERIRQQQRGARPEAKNALSVALELQADCFAGIWAKSTEQRKLIEAGDLDEALAAASAVGDDRIQKQTTGTIRPETFTHGSAADRSAWFRKGFTTGSLEACDTFR
jgi:hypothetical protein